MPGRQVRAPRAAPPRSLLQDHSDEQRVTNIELFFDLVYVFAVTQMSHHLLAEPTVDGAVQTALLLALVWWAWVYTTWATNWLDAQRIPVRLMLIALMLVSLVMSAALPGAFGSRGLIVASAYVLMQVGRSAFVAIAGRGQRVDRIFTRVTLWSGPGRRRRARGARLDAREQRCNHNYMSTEQERPAEEPTDADDTTSAASQAGDSADGAEEETRQDAEGSPGERLRGWFAGRLPAGWFTAVPMVQADREEITVVGTLPDPETAAEASDAERSAAAEGRIRRFREETRARRVDIAREAEHRFRRKVSWGATCGGRTEMFTTLSVPVMTRLRQSERRVLDTLVEGGVARSRSDALAWCVRLVGQHEDSWLADLRSALRRVEEVRSGGPRT